LAGLIWNKYGKVLGFCGKINEPWVPIKLWDYNIM
jgi:hypothetical protein